MILIGIWYHENYMHYIYARFDKAAALSSKLRLVLSEKYEKLF